MSVAAENASGTVDDTKRAGVTAIVIASSGDSGANVKRLEQETETKIHHLKTEAARISYDVVQMLLKQNCRSFREFICIMFPEVDLTRSQIIGYPARLALSLYNMQIALLLGVKV
ncbi:v-type proton atpase subunit g 1 [Quercus suber]|uniref:V-type proton atpase subunit g 1 n=1 Tax=Quercus suber TaxID=58331 RepID=A0AAW0JDP7_QUESU